MSVFSDADMHKYTLNSDCSQHNKYYDTCLNFTNSSTAILDFLMPCQDNDLSKDVYICKKNSCNHCIYHVHVHFRHKCLSCTYFRMFESLHNL